MTKEPARSELEERTLSFKSELKELLEKYNASIDFDAENCEEIYDQRFTIDFGGLGYSIPLTKKGSWSIEAKDLAQGEGK